MLAGHVLSHGRLCRMLTPSPRRMINETLTHSLGLLSLSEKHLSTDGTNSLSKSPRERISRLSYNPGTSTQRQSSYFFTPVAKRAIHYSSSAFAIPSVFHESRELKSRSAIVQSVTMLSRTALCLHHQALTRTNGVSRRIVYRSMHLACRIQSSGLTSHSILKLSKYAPVLGSCTKRYASTSDATTSTGDATADSILGIQTTTTATTPIANATTNISGTTVAESLTSEVQLDPIPDVPVPPTVLDTVSYAGEPPLSDIGLGSWWPPGMIQQSLEFLHVSLGLPWWEAIAVGTLILRLALFPLVIVAQRNGARMSNTLPGMQRLQTLMTEARQEGDQLKAARYSQELVIYMKKNNCNPLKNMIVPMAQAPIFISCFLGLRKMAEYPVESMKEGGLWWFTDLTVPDPYYVLPLITAATLAATIELGTDSARAETMGSMRYVLRAVPILVFPFTINFPGAVLCYWVSSNFISLIQVGILRIPKVRTYFNIDPLVKHPPKVLGEKKGFVEGFKSSWSNLKAAREANARYQVDEVQFHQAGRGPLRKTYSYDPTKQFSANQKRATVMAKKR